MNFRQKSEDGSIQIHLMILTQRLVFLHHHPPFKSDYSRSTLWCWKMRVEHWQAKDYCRLKKVRGVRFQVTWSQGYSEPIEYQDIQQEKKSNFIFKEMKERRRKFWDKNNWILDLMLNKNLFVIQCLPHTHILNPTFLVTINASLLYSFFSTRNTHYFKTIVW